MNKCNYYVYALKNPISGEFYIGSTKNIKERLRKHIKLMKYGHHTDKIQKSYNDNKVKFVMQVLLIVSEELRFFYEELVIKGLGPTLNSSKNGRGGSGAYGEKNPMFGRIGSLNPMYGKTGEKSPHFGKKRPDHGRKIEGDKNPRTKITRENALEIYNSCFSSNFLSKKFGISAAHIRAIKTKKTWICIHQNYTWHLV